MDEFKEITNSASSSTSKFGSILKSTVANIGIAAFINLVISGIAMLTDYIASCSKRLQEASEKASELSEESMNNAEALVELKNQLATGIENTNELTSAFKEQLKTMGYTETEINTLIKKYGGLAGAINQATIKALENAKTDAFASKSLAAQELEDAYDGTNLLVHAKDSVFSFNADSETNSTKYEDLNRQIETILSDVAEYSELNVGYRAKSNSAEDIYKYYQGMLKVSQLIQEYANKYGDQDLLKLEGTGETIYGEVVETIDGLSEAAQKYGDAIDKIHSADAQLEMANYLKTHSIQSKKDLDTYIQSIQKNATYSEEYKQVLIDTANEAFPQFLDAATETFLNTSKVTDKITLSLDELTAASDNISTLTSAFNELSDNGYMTIHTISSIKDAVGDSIPNWDEYEKKLLTVKKGTAEYNQLMSGLTYATLEKQLGGVSSLAQANEKYVSRLLEENGVLNANEVAHYAVERAKTIERIKTTDLAKAIEDGSIIALQNEALQCGYTEGAFWNLIAQEQIFNSTTLDVSQKINALKSLMAQAGITGSVISGLTGASSGIDKINDALALGVNTNKNGDITFNGNVYGKGQDALNKAMSDASAYAFQEELKKKYNSILVDYKNLTEPVDYSGNNDLSKETQETKETFNWIETALSRAQRAVTNFGKTVSATWRSWSTRNSELKKQITAINDELSLQQQARDTYLTKANSVGLPEPYKTLVQTGGIRIDEIADEGLKEKIKEYQEWYEKVLDCEDAMQDLNDELATLAKTKFDNVAKEFENLLSTIDHNTSMLDSYIELAETSGYTVSSKYYTSLIENEKKNFDLLEQERDALVANLNEAVNSGKITEGSELWYEMTSSINDLNVALIDSQISLAKYNNTLRELNWENFDKMQEKISRITDESDYLMDLMSDEKMYDDNGNMTDQGQATLGLHTVKHSTYKAQISDYEEALAEIRKLLAEDPYNQNLLDREQELIDSIQDTTLALKDEEQAIKDLYSEGYDALLDNMSKVIDKRKDMLSQAKEAYDYEKNIAEQTKDIAALEKQLAAYQGDDSEESRATIQKLKVSLEDAKENLEETEYEKYISDQEQMLDTLYSETEAWVNERLDNIDLLIQDAIDSASANSESIKETLQSVTGNVGTTLSNTMTEIWASNGTIGSTLANIEKYFADMKKEADEKAAKQLASTPAPSAPTTSSSSGSSSSAQSTTSSTASPSWGSWFINKKDSYNKNKLNTETSIVDRLKYKDIDSSFSARSQYYTAMGGSGKYTGSSSQNQWMLAQMKANRFDRGGIVGDLIRQTGEDGFALVRRGEGIIPTDMMPQWNALTQHLPQLNNALLSNLPQQATNLTIDIGDIQMYGVNNPEEFAMQLKSAMLNDNAIRQIMKDTTFGEALGKNSMIRYTR